LLAYLPRIPDRFYRDQARLLLTEKLEQSNHQQKEIAMQDVITIGKRFVPLEEIVFVEPFDPASNPEFKPEKDFKARVVLLNRDTVLAEFTPADFAVEHGFRVLAEDNVVANPAIAFRVESFEPSENFKPDKPYATRLKWRDRDGNERSRLLLSKPEVVIALLVRGEDDTAPPRKSPSTRPTGRRATRRNARKLEAVVG
jgi:hypothetical protein